MHPRRGLGEDRPFAPWVSFPGCALFQRGVMPRLTLPRGSTCFLGVRLLGTGKGVTRVLGGAREGVAPGHGLAAPPARAPRAAEPQQWEDLRGVQQELPPALPPPPAPLPQQGAGQGLPVAGGAALSSEQPGGSISVPPRPTG